MRKRLLTNFHIKDKGGNKVPFTHNKAQLHYEGVRTGWDFILKARQLGFTTYEQLRKFERVLLIPNITSATIAHQFGKTKDIFQITQYAWNSLPANFKSLYNVKYDSAKELYFSNHGSRYFVDMNVRSGTVQDLHISEFAYIKDVNELVSASFPSVPSTGSITIETTANGLNTAYDFWRDCVEGKNRFKAHFYNWAWDGGYAMTPPQDDRWRAEYKLVAKKYGLIEDIQSAHGLTNEQFYWYYFTSREQKEKMKQDYPTIAEEAFLSASISVFDLFKVAQLVPREVQAREKGAEIYYQPEAGRSYVIGCDTSEGVGGDRTTFSIWDFTDTKKFKEVASFQDATIRPDQMADLLYHFGKKYNDAYLIPERNGSGLTTVLKLQEKGYRRLYVKTSFDKISKRRQNEYGWRTTGGNRDMMIDEFVELFEEGLLEVNSNHLISEMKTFVRKRNGHREHDEGYHDDSLFSAFLAIQGRKYHNQHRGQVLNKDEWGFA